MKHFLYMKKCPENLQKPRPIRPAHDRGKFELLNRDGLNLVQFYIFQPRPQALLRLQDTLFGVLRMILRAQNQSDFHNTDFHNFIICPRGNVGGGLVQDLT